LKIFHFEYAINEALVVILYNVLVTPN